MVILCRQENPFGRFPAFLLPFCEQNRRFGRWTVRTAQKGELLCKEAGVRGRRAMQEALGARGAQAMQKAPEVHERQVMQEAPEARGAQAM